MSNMAQPPHLFLWALSCVRTHVAVSALHRSGFTQRHRVHRDQADRIDLLFTDIRLPGMDGWQLAAEIRARYGEVPVIYASGYAERLTPLPRSRFLQKPYLPSQVLHSAAELGIKLQVNPPS